MYDLEKLREDIDMRKILPYIVSSDEIKYAGATMYVKCVSGLHTETRIEHNAVSEKYCHCFSCGENYDAFSYIKKYYENQGFSLTFSEICEKIGDALGGADYYTTEEKTHKKNSTLLSKISKEDMKVIGISTTTGKNTPSLIELYETDPEKILQLLRDRAYEKMLKYGALSERLENKKLREAYAELHKKCREIYENLGGTEKSMVTLFRL